MILKLIFISRRTPYLLRETNYTDKVSYHIDVVKTDYDQFIDFLNRNTSGNYDLIENEVVRLPFDIPTSYLKIQIIRM